MTGRIAMAGLALVLASCGQPGDNTSPDMAKPSGLSPDEIRSGTAFLTPETQALQNDSFGNPGYLWVDRGEALFSAPAGEAPACASCHSEPETALDGAAARYPSIDKASGVMVNIEGRINLCRERHQDQPDLAYESDELLSLTAYVSSLSNGAPRQVELTTATRPYFERGEQYFFTRRGQLNLACSQCHNEHWGQKLRGDTISQGHGNGFPTYRFEWQALGSLHRRFHDCDKGVRAEPRALGSEEYVALEYYLAHRSGGLPIETPSVRR